MLRRALFAILLEIPTDKAKGTQHESGMRGGGDEVIHFALDQPAGRIAGVH